MSSNITKNFKAKSALRKEHGGDVKGPGGPTEDKVGPVALSDGEYVLPADTVRAVGVDNLDRLRAATHDFESTAGKTKIPGRLRGMAAGGVFYVDPEGRAARGPAMPQTGTSMVPTQPPAAARPGTSLVPTQPPAAAPPPAASAVRPELMGEAGRASARASAYSAAGNPAGARFAGGTPTPPASTPAASSAPGAASRAGNALRGLGKLAGAAGTAYSLVDGTRQLAKDYESGYFDQVKRESGLGNGAASVALGLANAGDLFGIPSKIGGAIGSKLGGGTFAEGWDRGNGRAAFEAQQTAAAPAASTPASPANAATPVAASGLRMANEKPPTGPQYYADLERQHQQEIAARAGGNREANARMQAAGGPGAYNQGALENRSGLANSDPRINGSTSAAYNALGDDAVVGSFNGRNITKKEADARAAGLQTASFMPQKPAEDPIMGEIRSALRGIGGGSRGGGSSFSGRDSGTEAINKRYDDLLRGGAGRNVVKGSDWSQRHGLSVETARAKELGDYAQNQSTLRGQDNSASIAADQNRTQLANTLINMQAQREKALAEGNSASAKAQQDALKNAAEANQQGYENFTKATESMFIGPEGKPDTAMREQFMDFVAATDPKFLEENVGVSSIKDLFALSPQEQMAASQKLKTMMQMQQAANASRSEGVFNSGMQSTGFEAPVGAPREYSLRDVASGNLSPSRYAYNFINPFADDRVQELASGSVVPYDEYVGKSADREKARKSNLRNP